MVRYDFVCLPVLVHVCVSVCACDSMWFSCYGSAYYRPTNIHTLYVYDDIDFSNILASNFCVLRNHILTLIF